MEAENTRNETTIPETTVLQNLRFGFRVWTGEIRLMLIGIGRCFEVHQLEKRLEQECAILGRFTAEHLGSVGEEPASPSFDMIRSARQIQFLNDEILRLRLEQEAAADREQTRKRKTYCV